MATVDSDIMQGSTYTLRHYADTGLVVDSAIQPIYVDQISGVSLEGLKEAAEAANEPSDLGDLSLPSTLEIKQVQVERFTDNSAFGVVQWGRTDWDFSFPQSPKTVRTEDRSITVRRFISTSGTELAEGATVARGLDGSALTADRPSAEWTIIIRVTEAGFTNLADGGDGASNVGKWNSNVFQGLAIGSTQYLGSLPTVHGFRSPADSGRKIAFWVYRYRVPSDWHVHFVKPDNTVGVYKPNEQASNQTTFTDPDEMQYFGFA